MAEAYKILGIDHTATPAQRKAAYVKKIGEWHPDRNPSPHATAWAQAINWAFDYLKQR
jgi:DnaJ-class molecular chaperone